MIGIDLVEVDRFTLDEKFISRIADEEEIGYINSAPALSLQRLAALWAVKEAVIKALNLGGTGVSFRDIKLCHEETGKPYVELFGKAKQEMDAFHYGKRVEVSLSHTKNYSTAIAIIV